MSWTSHIPDAWQEGKAKHEAGRCSRSRAAPGSLLSNTAEEIQELRQTEDPIFIQAAKELEAAANYAFPANDEDRQSANTKSTNAEGNGEKL
jgi:soluble P-type ATPase